MKKIKLFLCIYLLANLSVLAQDKCSKFYPINDNASFTHTIYDKEPADGGVEQGKVTYSVNEVLQDSAVYTVTIKTFVEDLGREMEMNSQFGIKCTDAGVEMGFAQMGAGMMGRFNNAKITGNNIYVPNELSLDQTLPDAEMKVSTSAGPTRINMTRKMMNRKVLDRKENIEIDGNSLECYVLTYDVEMNMGSTGMIFTTKTKQWLYEGLGTIKSKEWDKDGNLTGVTILTSYRLN